MLGDYGALQRTRSKLRSLRSNLKPTANTGAIMTAITTKYATANGWLIVDHKDSSGTESLVLTSSAGAKYTVTIVQGPQLSITALSACFPNAGLTNLKSY